MSSKEYPYADILRAIITGKVLQFQLSKGSWVDQSAEDTLFEISKKIYEPERYREKPRVMVINGKACAASAQAVPASVIMASVMRDDGGEHPAFCLMVAYRAEKDAKAALAMLTDEPALDAQNEVKTLLRKYRNLCLKIGRGDSQHIARIDAAIAAQRGGEHG